MGGLNFNPDLDVPDLSGKVSFITGGTAGIGTQTALHLAKHNVARIYISGRSSASANGVIQAIQAVQVQDQGQPRNPRTQTKTDVIFVRCDLTSLASVKDAATRLLETESRLDLTKDGYEVQFGTDHLGHAMLIRHLLPLLQNTARIRFNEMTTSQDHGFMWSWFRYGQSKLANLLYIKELSLRYPGITSASRAYPSRGGGFTYVTTIGQKLTVEEGCYNCLWAASTNKRNLVNGGFYEPVGVEGGLGSGAKDEGLAGQLWEWTEEVLDKY
ncbi:oxidoreductase, short-chain dehydrogenase/reductase family [Aspergillus undulatus]|uniref:oxidoreductase, short-chain dehydrogenase/reductase family n=1 Tax=Aspergillus undulatus TaxID=1810928 RepID=UPI003CCCE3C9